VYRNDGNGYWTGYVHEELVSKSRDRESNTAKSSLVFDHISSLRDEERIIYKRSMYDWMLLRAYDNPSVRGGTNAWWYQTFVPNNIELIRENAHRFEAQERLLDLSCHHTTDPAKHL
jgi:hypothetical protein